MDSCREQQRLYGSPHGGMLIVVDAACDTERRIASVLTAAFLAIRSSLQSRVSGCFASNIASSQGASFMRRVLLSLSILACLATTRLVGQQPADQSADEAAIRKAAASYMEAFNRHDAKALADLWSPDAVYLNRSTGEEVVGRAAIAEQFAAQFKEQPEVKVEVS